MNNKEQLPTAFEKLRRIDHWTKAHCVLAVIWMAESCCLLTWMVAGLIHVLLDRARAYPAETFPLLALGILAAMCGIIGGAFLFKGSGWGRRTVRFIALVTAVVSVWQIHLAIPLWLGGRLFIEREMLICGGVALFGLVTVMLLHPPRNRDSQPNPRA
jgi:hypothetical protein